MLKFTTDFWCANYIITKKDIMKNIQLRNYLIAPAIAGFIGLCVASCNGGSGSSGIDWVALQDAQEIYYVESSILTPTVPIPTYKSSGSNPISAEAWPSYTPPQGYLKNTTRYLQFNEQSLIASPGDPAGQYTYITTSDGYTWVQMTNTVSAMWPYNRESFNQTTGVSSTDPFNAAILVTTPPAGVIKMTSNYKAQYMKYYANESNVPSGQPGAIPIPRYFISDQWGNKYIMQASGQESAMGVYNAFQSAVLPSGWTKEIAYLSEDLILSPATASGGYYDYVLFRDSADNTYNQIEWSPSGYNIAAQIESQGMPIWGGLNNDVLRITQSFNNQIFGGGGANTFIFSVSSGTNTIEDFNGGNGDRLNFSGQTYTTSDTANGIQISLSGGAIVVLNGIHSFSSAWVVQ